MARPRTRAALPTAGVVMCLLAAAACTAGGGSGPAAPAGRARQAALPSDRSLQALAATVQRDIARTWPHTERIWPGVDYSDRNALITDGRTAWEVSPAGRRQVSLDALRAAGIEPPKADGFKKATWRGKKSIIMHPPDRAEWARLQRDDPVGVRAPDLSRFSFELVTHEPFHLYEQLGEPWPSMIRLLQKSSGDRDQLYPLRAGPRIDRAMLYNSLLAAYEEPAGRDEHLSAAAYWQRAWERDYPKQAKNMRQVDLAEGTAEYFEQSAVAMARSGGPGDAAGVRGYFTRTLEPMRTPAADFEPYAIGLVALLTADAMHRDVKKTLTTDPVTPAQTVLRGVEPARRQSAPDDVAGPIRTETDKENKRLSGSIDPFVKRMRDPGYATLLLPRKAVRSMRNDEHAYTTRQLPESILPDPAIRFRFATGSLALDGVTVAQETTGGKEYIALPVRPGHGGTRLDGDRLVLDGAGMEGRFTVKSRTDDGGRRLLYAR